jgi:hypothetical protein
MNLRRFLALTTIPLAAAALAACPGTASADPLKANCIGRQSIWGDSFQIHGSAGTVCDTSADYLSVTVYIRHRDKLGYVSTCGVWNQATANWTTTVTADASSCLSSGTGDEYWIYSEHYASVGAQVFDFSAGGWDTPT